MSEEQLIAIRFKEQTEYGEYNDVLYYPIAEYSRLSREAIDEEKSRRVRRWVELAKNPPPIVPPSRGEQMEVIISLHDRVDEEEISFEGNHGPFNREELTLLVARAELKLESSRGQLNRLPTGGGGRIR